MTLERSGDPRAALVLALATNGTVEEATQFAALLRARLQRLEPTSEVRPHVGGVTVTAWVDSSASVKRVAQKLDQVVRRRVETGELDQPEYLKHLRQLQQQVLQPVTAAERVVCLDAAASNGATALTVEQVRSSAFAESRARWGVVGSNEYSEAMQLAVEELPVWPRQTTTGGSWPNHDAAIFTAARDATARIDVAVRTPLAEMAVAAGRELQAFSGDPQAMLDSLPVAMSLTRVSVTPQLVGGCLGLSLSPQVQGSAPTVEELILAARLLVQETRRLVEQSGRNATATLQAIEETDPRRAGEAVTWQSLSDEAAGKSPRIRVEVDVGTAQTSVTPTPDQRRLLVGATNWNSVAAELPLVKKLERGQGNLYALLATPCGTWNESSKTVGATSLMLRALAEGHRADNQVTLQPWTTANGAGILAQSRRLNADETADQMAHRLGDTLGRVLVASKLDSGDLWQARHDALTRLGPSPRAALWRGVLAISSQNPGLVLPEGTYATVEAMSLLAIRERRLEWLRMPLRLAVLENDDGDQAATVRRALGRWVSASRNGAGQCPNLDTQPEISGDSVQISSRLPDPADAAVAITAVLPVGDAKDEGHAELLEYLLNEPTAWLAQRLRDNNIVGTVEARVIGGLQRRGLVVAVGVLPSAADAAATAIRGLLQELGSGALPRQANLSRAIADLNASNLQKRLDPRVRVEDLWTSRSKINGASESSFRAYLRRAFEDLRLVTVRTNRTQAEPEAPARNRR